MDNNKEDKVYDGGVDATSEPIMCEKDHVLLAPTEVTLSYMDSAFPVVLPACPICHMVYIPEELSIGKILRVEKSLEDK